MLGIFELNVNKFSELILLFMENTVIGPSNSKEEENSSHDSSFKREFLKTGFIRFDLKPLEAEDHGGNPRAGDEALHEQAHSL